MANPDQVKFLDSMCDRDRDRHLSVADALRDAFVAVRRKHGSPGYRMSAKWDKTFWTGVAIKLIRDCPEHLDAVRYCEFQHCRTGPNVPPNFLATAAAINAWRAECRGVEPLQEAEQYSRYQLELVRLLLDAGRNLRDILTDSKVELNAAVTYCLSRSGQLSDLADFYRPEAQRFVDQYPAYLRSTLLSPYVSELARCP